MRRFVAVLVFFMLADDGNALYEKYMFTPLAWTHPFLTGLSPIKVHGFDVMVAIVLALAYGRKDTSRATVRPMRQMLHLVLGTTVAWFAFGVLRGGDARAGLWQIYLILSALLFAFTVSSVFTRYEHYVFLAKAVLAAALYRAVMCVLFWAFYIRNVWWETYPPHLTSHDDTVLWVVAIVMLLVNALTKVTKQSKLWAALVIPLLVIALQLNARRLAWVSLGAALLVVYALVRSGRIKRRINRTLLYVVPVLVLYVAIGWGRKEAVFRPLRSIETISTEEDDSTKARNVENLGLIATAREAGPILGTGYGHKYKELSDRYSIASSFEMWPYIPHNSILGLLAFTGILGFAGFWMAFPTAMFLHARVARLAPTPREQAIGIVSAAQLVICANQLYGDMGLASPPAMYLLATSYAIAMRMPIAMQVWPAPAPRTVAPSVPGAPGVPGAASATSGAVNAA
jgi:O-Antigen ligase